MHRNTKLGAIEGKIVETTMGGLVSKARDYSIMTVLPFLAQITFRNFAKKKHYVARTFIESCLFQIGDGISK